MRIAQSSCDWKDSLSDEEIRTGCLSVGGEKLIYQYDQDNVDSKVVYYSSHPLSDEQLDELWEAGDLFTGDNDYWEGSFKEIISQIRHHMEKQGE